MSQAKNPMIMPKFATFLLFSTLLIAPSQSQESSDHVFKMTGSSDFDTRMFANFDFDTGNVLKEVVFPLSAGFFVEYSPRFDDPPIVLRFTSLNGASYFDAIAPYHPTAIGIFSRLGRRPPEERTQRNKNIAMLYANYRIGISFFPTHADDWAAVVKSLGLDPNDDHESTEDAIGIGNMAGNAVLAARLHDGMNQLGDEGRTYNFQPYADYTGYEPVNTAYELKDPSRWQPALVRARGGNYRAQQFITPYMGSVRPYFLRDPQTIKVEPPTHSDPIKDPAGYKTQADEVLAASAALTDEQKMAAELFNNKAVSLESAASFADRKFNHDLNEFVELRVIGQLSGFDTLIPIFAEKRRHDAVRPFSAVRYLYGDELVTAWGGPGTGSVDDIKASEWESYLPVADHPEYPSITTAICEANAEVYRRYTGTDESGLVIPRAKGTSFVEPGVTPADDIVLKFDTWTEFADVCGQSRLWGGVHFQAAIDSARPVGRQVGALAYEFVKAHIDGTAGPLE